MVNGNNDGQKWSAPSRKTLPLILIRGFGGLGVDDERQIAYQGFNDGTVYPLKRGENYIYEGLVLKLMKSDWKFNDATNIVGYFPSTINEKGKKPEALKELPDDFFFGSKMVIDPGMALRLIQSEDDPLRTIWVFRYYDLNDREFKPYGEALVRLIDFIRELGRLKTGSKPKVNIIAHSMGGLIVREAIQRTYPERKKTKPGTDSADDSINKIITLGTPHKGISFQVIKDLRWLAIQAENELKHFNPEFQKDEKEETSFVNTGKCFPLDRFLCVVGTNYKTYSVTAASWANRLFSVSGEYGPTYNRSDGLVKQAFAQIDGAPRTFINKCHGGSDSIVTARETYEIARRFFFGDVRARLRLVEAEVTRGFDMIGHSEFFLGVSIKPRGVDFELFHQSREAENCYGPFRSARFDDVHENLAFPWAGPDRLIWEGWFDSRFNEGSPDMVMRLDIYVGERDVLGLGFSDNVIFHKQYFVRAVYSQEGDDIDLFLYTGEEFQQRDIDQKSERMAEKEGRWEFTITGTGFKGTFGIELDAVPVIGLPVPFKSAPNAE